MPSAPQVRLKIMHMLDSLNRHPNSQVGKERCICMYRYIAKHLDLFRPTPAAVEVFLGQLERISRHYKHDKRANRDLGKLRGRMRRMLGIDPPLCLHLGCSAHPVTKGYCWSHVGKYMVYTDLLAAKLGSPLAAVCAGYLS